MPMRGTEVNPGPPLGLRRTERQQNLVQLSSGPIPFLNPDRLAAQQFSRFASSDLKHMLQIVIHLRYIESAIPYNHKVQAKPD